MVSTRDAEVELIGTVRSVVWFLQVDALLPEERLKLVWTHLKIALDKLDLAREQELTLTIAPRALRRMQDDK